MRIGITGTVSAGKTTVLKFLKAKNIPFSVLMRRSESFIKTNLSLNRFQLRLGSGIIKFKKNIKELITKKRN